MDIELLRTLKSAEPFKSFQLIMNDGRKLLVDRRYFLGLGASGRICWSTLDEWFEFFTADQVKDIAYIPQRRGSHKKLPRTSARRGLRR